MLGSWAAVFCSSSFHHARRSSSIFCIYWPPVAGTNNSLSFALRKVARGINPRTSSIFFKISESIVSDILPLVFIVLPVIFMCCTNNLGIMVYFFVHLYKKRHEGENMKKSSRNIQKTEEETTIKIKDKILKEIQKKGFASLAELTAIHETRHVVLYHIRKLIKNEDIRAYIKLKQDSESRSILDEEICFTFANRYEHPQDILNLINEMCGDNSELRGQAKLKFIDLYVERVKTTEPARKRLAKKQYIGEHYTEEDFEDIWEKYLKGNNEQTARLDVERLSIFLMTGLNPEFKKKVAFQLAFKDKNGLYNTRFDYDI